ncbi:carbohydrate-binding module family 20 isoform A [Chlorella sorokiniana]|jgi:hypothetical protein|uniref:Carbohydrate-binding module family 20 isoform A n=1 Tax=Chlorella sorokiniana TaxID=3076 RepID=A0A2P6TX79_CHLSO|nr:carbohydrate-binding module family 20 isoform A [Chlorella sorokiniana]|eukprot:PRW58670.1 carbohydrate-binding module family 20 isoform A [Chlorella sorokiniana]
MRATAQAPSALSARPGSRLGAKPGARRSLVRCQASPDEPSIASKMAVALTAVSASWALGTGSPALAADAPAAPTRPAAELQAEVEKRNADALNKMANELEASKAAAVKSVKDLQARLAAEHAQMLKLQGELKSAKSELLDAQKEVEKEKGLLVSAKRQAAEAAEAARQAEMALRGQAGLDTLKSPLGLAATSGWTLAAIIAVTKGRKSDDESFDYDSAEGREKSAEMRAGMEAVRAEADTLRRDLTQQTQRLSELTAQLEQERGQNATLRETVLIMEAEVTDLEARMTMAKTEAFELQRKLETALKEKSGGSGSKPALSLFSSSSSKPASSSTPKTTTPVSSSATPLDTASLNGRASALSGSGSGVTGSGKPVRVTFTLPQELPFGQSLKLVGSHPALGAWKEDMGLRMTWGDGHKWTTSVSLPAGTALEFKAVKIIEGPDARSEWEDGANHVLLVPSSGFNELFVKVEWGAGTSIMDNLPGSSSAASSSSSSSGINGSGSSSSAKKNDSHSTSSSKALASSRSSKWGGLLG